MIGRNGSTLHVTAGRGVYCTAALSKSRSRAARLRSSDRPYDETHRARGPPQPCSDHAPDSDVTALFAPSRAFPAPRSFPEPIACRSVQFSSGISVQFTSAADSPWQNPPGAERYGCGGSHNAGIGPTADRRNWCSSVVKRTRKLRRPPPRLLMPQ